jgi:hypothetical protein
LSGERAVPKSRDIFEPIENLVAEIGQDVGENHVDRVGTDINYRNF